MIRWFFSTQHSGLSIQHFSSLRTQHSALLLAVLLSGCGYQFRVEGPGPTIGGEPVTEAGNTQVAPTLSIPSFINRSLEPNLEVKYTTYARREFASGSGAVLVSPSQQSDLVMTGVIVGVIVPTLAFTRTETQESRVTVYVLAKIQNTRTKETIFNQTVTASSEFFVTQDLQFNRVLQARALEQAGEFVAQDLAARFLNHLENYGLKTSPPSVPGGPMMPGAGAEGFRGR